MFGNVVAPTVLPAASERLLKHWKALDRAAGEGEKFSDTLRGIIRIRVPGGDDSREADLCQRLLVRSLSSGEAVSRTAPVAPSAAIGGTPRQVRGRVLPTFAPMGHQSPDDELIGRVLRGYRTFASIGIFRDIIIGGRSGFDLAVGLWSAVLDLPEGLRPAAEHRANTALRLAIELGLPTTTTAGGSEGMWEEESGLLEHGKAAKKRRRRVEGETGDDELAPRAASIVAGVLDVRPAARVRSGSDRDRVLQLEGDRREAGAATRGALFYRRFSDPIHEALLRPAGDRRAAWPAACVSLVDACLTTKDSEFFAGARPLRASQAFSVLEGVVTLQMEQRRAPAMRFGVMAPRDTLVAIVPEFRRLLQHPDWMPPGFEPSDGNSRGSTGRMLRESLRLCSRLLRLAASENSGTFAATVSEREDSRKLTSPILFFQELLEMSGVLVAGTLGSSSPVVEPSVKADALTLVPFFRPCLTHKAKEFGHDAPRASSLGDLSREAKVLSALEEMVARHFPLDDSREPAQGSQEAKNFALLLRGLLRTFVRSGDLGLLELLFGTLAEGRKHLHYSWVSRALEAFVSDVDVEGDGVVEAVFSFCLDKMSQQRLSINVKAILVDKVCLPLLSRCPLEISRLFYISTTVGPSFNPGPKGANSNASLLQRLQAVVDRRGQESGKFLAGPLVASFCFALLEALYEMLERDALRVLADQALGKNEALREVTKSIAKAWKAVKEGGASSGAAEQVRL